MQAMKLYSLTSVHVSKPHDSLYKRLQAPQIPKLIRETHTCPYSPAATPFSFLLLHYVHNMLVGRKPIPTLNTNL